ncbi:DUF4442 domain-containing protein [Flagellimonas beolgyonensis]|uniref:DUF4442 domain-containing protein n=1 Tax=Flagellimonas beolgyonensis TaxID=864064 RepID=UPI000F8D65B7|nr:DUF4442 domain-containing protein [Allomuricauda beolgyonensis]
MNTNTIKILERFFKKSTIFKYTFKFDSAYKRSTGSVYFVSDNLQVVKVKIPLTYKNRNYKGTLFGGAMSSATDPIFMIQLITILGENYVVWDKAASIKFKRPGNQTMFADFILSDEFIESIKTDIANHNEKTYKLHVNITDKSKAVYAEVEREIYIASKDHYKKKKSKRKTV